MSKRKAKEPTPSEAVKKTRASRLSMPTSFVASEAVAMIHADVDNVDVSSVDDKMLSKLITKSNRAQVYEKLMDIFCKVDASSIKYLEKKFFYYKAQKALIDKMKLDVTSDKGLTTGKDILKSFKAILDKYGVEIVSNQFVFSFYLNVIDDLGEQIQAQMNDAYFKLFEKYFEIEIKCERMKWMQSCLNKPLNIKELYMMIRYSHLIQFIGQTRLIDSLVKLSIRLLDTYGTRLNEFNNRAKTINQNFSLLARFILEDLFKKCKEARKLILSRYMEKIINSDDKRIIFIDQLNVVLNSKSSLLKLFAVNNQTEREDLYKTVVNTLDPKLKIPLTVSTAGKSASKQAAAAKAKGLMSINNCQHVVKLFDALRVLIFSCFRTDSNNTLSLIVQSGLTSSTSSRETKNISALAMLSLLKALNLKHVENKFWMKPNDKDMYLDQERCLTDNTTVSIAQLTCLLHNLDGETLDVHVKSYIYQSLKLVLKSNKNLVVPVMNLFEQQLGRYLIKSTQDNKVYFDLNKCLSPNRASNSFKLAEPIDVLFHCAVLCLPTALVHVDGNMNHPAVKTLQTLKTTIKSVIKTYIESESSYMYDLYKAQLIDRIKANTSPTTCLKILHQIELGLMDVVIEHLVKEDLFDELPKILQKYENTSGLISAEIENLMSEKMTTNKLERSKTTELGRKRKLAPSTTETASVSAATKAPATSTRQSMKRFKSEDKENIAPTQPSQPPRAANKRQALAPLSTNVKASTSQAATQPIPLVEPKPQQQPQAQSTNKGLTLFKSLSFANMQFEHTYRISYKGCLKMVAMYLGLKDNVKIFKTNKMSNLNFFASMMPLLSDQKFIDYLMKVCEKKLKSLLNSDDLTAVDLYDPLSCCTFDLFSFLAFLWSSFTKRISGSDGEQSVFKSDMTMRFGQVFFNRTYRLIQFTDLIWQIATREFQSIRYYLESYENLKINQLIEKDFYNVSQECEHKQWKLFWKFLNNCARSIKCLLNPCPSNMNVANKCCLAFLNLMHDIVLHTDLNEDSLDIFSNWLFDMADEAIASEEEIGKAIVRLLAHISCKRDSPVILSKYIALDYYNFVYLNDDESSFNRNSVELILASNLFTQPSNLIEYQKIINQQLFETFEMFKWLVDTIGRPNQVSMFNVNKLVSLMIKQLETTVFVIFYLLKSVATFATVELNLSLMVRFYDFLGYLFQTDLCRSLDYDRRDMLKDLISTIAMNVQANLSHELNRIKSLIIINEQPSDEKANSVEILNILKYRQLIINLINSVDSFENNLIKLNDQVKNETNLLENYKIFINNLEMSLDNKIVRTVSEQEINSIIVMVEQND